MSYATIAFFLFVGIVSAQTRYNCFSSNGTSSSSFTLTNSAASVSGGYELIPGSANTLGQIYYNSPVGVGNAWKMSGSISFTAPSYSTQNFDTLVSFFLQRDLPTTLPGNALSSRNNIMTVQFNSQTGNWSTTIASPNITEIRSFGQVAAPVLNTTLYVRTFTFTYESNYSIPEGYYPIPTPGFYFPVLYSNNGSAYLGVVANTGSNFARVVLNSWEFYSSDCAPGTTTAAPGTTTAAPGTTTAAPGTTTAAPGTTTAAPGTTTAAPGTTTAAPGTTTAAPGTTTAAPGSTTAAPGSTTAAPGSTTAAPGSTTAAPGSTTAAPGSTTAAPGSTTAAPGSTTAAPGSTTAAPGSTTAAPTGSDTNTVSDTNGSTTVATTTSAPAPAGNNNTEAGAANSLSSTISMLIALIVCFYFVL